MSEIIAPGTKSIWQSKQVLLAVASLLMFLKSKFAWSWLPKSFAEAEEYVTVGVALVTTFLAIRERIVSQATEIKIGPVLSKVFITPKTTTVVPPPATVGLLLVASLALSGCALIGPSAEEAYVLKDATHKMIAASEQSDEVYAKSLKVFRDELITRSFGEIQQAERDEINEASKDGLLPEEANAISKHGRDLLEEALKHITAGYDTAREHPAHKQFAALQQKMSFYWLTRLGNDQLKMQLIEQIKGLAPTEK